MISLQPPDREEGRKEVRRQKDFVLYISFKDLKSAIYLQLQ
jgi:hypothetical protein